MIMKRKKQTLIPAFTLLELVFVIVILGILVALAIPRMNRDLRQEAADNILSAIRYTQHLALTDNKHRFDTSNWLQRLWLIRFEQYGDDVVFKIGSDMDQEGNIDKEESAIDPLTKKYLFTTDSTEDSDESRTVFLTKYYDITDVTFNDCHGELDSDAKHIAFDNLGRPHRGVLDTSGSGGADNTYNTYIDNKQCEITFSSDSFNDIKIIILPETGYAYIDGQEDS